MPSVPSNRNTGLTVSCMLCVTGAIALGHTNNGTAEADHLTPSTLLVERAECTQPRAAAHWGLELLESADAKLVRIAAWPAAGRQAYAELTEAERCLSVAGDANAAAKLHQRLSQQRSELEAEYRAHQLRLHWAMQHEDRARARLEATRLLAMLDPIDDTYTQWLHRLTEAQP